MVPEGNDGGVGCDGCDGIISGLAGLWHPAKINNSTKNEFLSLRK